MVAGFIPFDAGRSAPRELPERVFIELPHPNISPVERVATLIGGLVIGLEGLRRRERLGPWVSLSLALGGGFVVARAIGGYCPLEAYFQNRREAEELRLGPHEGRVRQFLPRILRSISIRASREEVISCLNDLPNVDGVRFEVLGEPSIEEINWRCQKLGAFGTNEAPSHHVFGVIRLIDGPPNKGVELQASIDDIPVGISAEEVENMIRRVLRSLKQFVEAGEIATTTGQSHGRRKRLSIKARLSRLVRKFMNKEELRHVGAVLERN